MGGGRGHNANTQKFVCTQKLKTKENVLLINYLPAIYQCTRLIIGDNGDRKVYDDERKMPCYAYQELPRYVILIVLIVIVGSHLV